MANGYTMTQSQPSQATYPFANPFQFQAPFQSQPFQTPYQFQSPLQAPQFGGMTPSMLPPQDWTGIITPIVRAIVPFALSQFQAQPIPGGYSQPGAMAGQPWPQGLGPGGSQHPQELTTTISSLIQSILPVVLSALQAQPTYGDGARFRAFGAQPWGQGSGYFGTLHPQELTAIVGSVVQSVLPVVLSLLQGQPNSAVVSRFPAYA